MSQYTHPSNMHPEQTELPELLLCCLLRGRAANNFSDSRIDNFICDHKKKKNVFTLTWVWSMQHNFSCKTVSHWFTHSGTPSRSNYIQEQAIHWPTTDKGGPPLKDWWYLDIWIFSKAPFGPKDLRLASSNGCTCRFSGTIHMLSF